jgi:hypothetical protein
MIEEKEIKERIINEISEGLHRLGIDGITTDNVISVDLKNQEIVIKFNYNIVEDDNYIGLANY